MVLGIQRLRESEDGLKLATEFAKLDVFVSGFRTIVCAFSVIWAAKNCYQSQHSDAVAFDFSRGIRLQRWWKSREYCRSVSLKLCKKNLASFEPVI